MAGNRKSKRGAWLGLGGVRAIGAPERLWPDGGAWDYAPRVSRSEPPKVAHVCVVCGEELAPPVCPNAVCAECFAVLKADR